MSPSFRLVDLSHRIAHGEGGYPGLPAPRVGAVFTHAESAGRYAPGTEFHVGRVELCTNSGTYVDAPFHRFRDRPDIAALPLERLAGVAGLVVDAEGPAIGPDALAGRDLRGRAVLLRTGWSRHWGTEAYGAGGHPFLTRAAAEAIRDGGAAILGIDSLNVDATTDAERPAHTTLLAAGIPIVEHLAGLDALPREGFRFFAVPAPVAGVGSFPVRAFAQLPG